MDNQYKVLAVKYGVYNKIDQTSDDKEYLQAWCDKLVELHDLMSQVPKTIKHDLSNISTNSFTNFEKIISDIKRDLHENFDLNDLRKAIDDYQNNYVSPTIKPPKYNCGDMLTKHCHVIDIDYEYMADGSYICIYARDVYSSDTFTVLHKYNDYFYIEIDDDHPVEFINKKINGYLWYLKENRYPDAAMTVNGDPRRFEGKDLRHHDSRINVMNDLVVSREIIEDHKSVYGYNPDNGKFLKISSNYPSVTTALFRGLSRKNEKMKFYEADADYVTKFMSETGICGCVGFSFEGKIIKNNMTHDDALVMSNNVSVESSLPMYVPRMMYYDIECLSLQENVFPTADSCPVIQISYILSEGVDKVIDKGVLCLKETPGYVCFKSFDTEERMLIAFAKIIREFNPDAITGYNSNAFDMPYIIDRMKALNIYNFASEITRRKNFRLDYKEEFKTSNQFGTKRVVKYVCPGRIMFDLFDLIKGDVTKKLRSYSLKAVCEQFLNNENKEDLRYKDIPKLFETPEGRKKIAIYCLKDTELLIKLDKVLLSGTTTWGMAKVLGTTPQVVLNRGLVFKLMCKLKQYTEKNKFLIPSFTNEQKPKFSGKFQGAFVLEPDLGFHEDPIVTLDFASLYPALMIGYNLSYDTFVWDRKLVEANPDHFEEHCGYTYVKSSVYKGLLPRLEEELAKERKAAKKKRDSFPDGSPEYNVYESLQLANKIIMNSLYGMLGSPTATVPNVEIAMTITGKGRDNLLAAKDYVEKNYNRLTGEKEKAKVIYGDTDSIFVKMPGITIEKAIEYGQMIDKIIQKDVFDARPPMRLEVSYDFTELCTN